MKWFSLIATDLSSFTFVESGLDTHSFNIVVRAKINVGTQKMYKPGDWKDGLVVKSICCSSRRPSSFPSTHIKWLTTLT